MPTPPSRAGICGKVLLLSSVAASACMPAIPETAVAGAVLALESSPGFCAVETAGAEMTCNPATNHATIKFCRMLITKLRDHDRIARLQANVLFRILSLDHVFVV